MRGGVSDPLQVCTDACAPLVEERACTLLCESKTQRAQCTEPKGGVCLHCKASADIEVAASRGLQSRTTSSLLNPSA